MSLQAELTDLEVKLENTTSYAADFREMRDHATNADNLQWQMLLDIRAKLQEYSITRQLHLTHSGNQS